jgi:aldose sugar dehydrogenase
MGKYEEPKLVWARSTGLTALVFLDSDKLGEQYNDTFVGNAHNGRIYHFKPTDDRNDLELPKSLSSRYVQNLPGLVAKDIVFGDGFVSVTDLTVGPDSYLYIVAI